MASQLIVVDSTPTGVAASDGRLLDGANTGLPSSNDAAILGKLT